MQESNDLISLQNEAERVRSSGLLGEARARKLFDYLLASSLQGLAPKELEIAIDVFGKTTDYDASQDALVRVYVHKLRRTLEEFYAARAALPVILSIPRGEYRLLVTPRTPAAVPTTAAAIGDPSIARGAPLEPVGFFRSRLGAGVIGAICLAATVACALGIVHFAKPPTPLERLRASPVWSAMSDDVRPIVIVVGDYYLIGETDQSMEVTRLIREFDVNSKADLDRYVDQHPEYSDRYMDVKERYLPISTAFALRSILPVLAQEHRSIQISPMSNLLPITIKSADIVYVGLISGLGPLQKLVFEGSRVAVGDSFDVLVDKSNGRSYYSQTATQALVASSNFGGTTSYRDYGYFAEFRGPDGNLIIVISGTRDEGVRQAAESFSDIQRIDELKIRPRGGAPYEALLEVSALDGLNLSGKVVLESNRSWVHP